MADEISGYVIRFGEPDGNGVVYSPDAFQEAERRVPVTFDHDAFGTIVVERDETGLRLGKLKVYPKRHFEVRAAAIVTLLKAEQVTSAAVFEPATEERPYPRLVAVDIIPVPYEKPGRK